MLHHHNEHYLIVDFFDEIQKCRIKRWYYMPIKINALFAITRKARRNIFWCIQKQFVALDCNSKANSGLVTYEGDPISTSPHRPKVPQS